MGGVGSRKLSSFIKRHNRLLSFIGALIVFVTFIVKDNLREHWKGTADAIDMAQYMYAIHVDAGGNQPNFAMLVMGEGQIRRLIQDPKERRDLNAEGKFPEEDIVSILIGVQQTLVSLSNCKILLDKLPHRSDDERDGIPA
jgi:hypothetical protein